MDDFYTWEASAVILSKPFYGTKVGMRVIRNKIPALSIGKKSANVSSTEKRIPRQMTYGKVVHDTRKTLYIYLHIDVKDEVSQAQER